MSDNLEMSLMSWKFFNSLLAVEKLILFVFFGKGDKDFDEDPEFDAELEYVFLTFLNYAQMTLNFLHRSKI